MRCALLSGALIGPLKCFSFISYGLAWGVEILNVMCWVAASQSLGGQMQLVGWEEIPSWGKGPEATTLNLSSFSRKWLSSNVVLKGGILQRNLHLGLGSFLGHRFTGSQWPILPHPSLLQITHLKYKRGRWVGRKSLLILDLRN